MERMARQNAYRLLAAIVCSLGLLAFAYAQRVPTVEAHSPSQAAADLMRTAAGADIAFLPTGLVKDNFDSQNLASLLVDPTDDLGVVNLRGSQVRKALEKSLAVYPQPNQGFLQISGMEVTFSRAADPERRLVSVTVGGVRLDDSKTYTVAMPGSLARGGLGYFKVWDRAQVQPTTPRQLSQVLRGKAATSTDPRWIAQ